MKLVNGRAKPTRARDRYVRGTRLWEKKGQFRRERPAEKVAVDRNCSKVVLARYDKRTVFSNEVFIDIRNDSL